MLETGFTPAVVDPSLANAAGSSLAARRKQATPLRLLGINERQLAMRLGV